MKHYLWPLLSALVLSVLLFGHAILSGTVMWILGAALFIAAVVCFALARVYQPPKTQFPDEPTRQEHQKRREIMRKMIRNRAKLLEKV